MLFYLLLFFSQELDSKWNDWGQNDIFVLYKKFRMRNGSRPAELE
jgi:hypothetical protein